MAVDATGGRRSPAGARHPRGVRPADRGGPALRRRPQRVGHQEERKRDAVPRPPAPVAPPHARALARPLREPRLAAGAPRRAGPRGSRPCPRRRPPPVREGPGPLRLPDRPRERGGGPPHPLLLPGARAGVPFPSLPAPPRPPDRLHRGDLPLRAEHRLRLVPLPPLRTALPRPGLPPVPVEGLPLRGEILLGEGRVRLRRPEAVRARCGRTSRPSCGDSTFRWRSRRSGG